MPFLGNLKLGLRRQPPEDLFRWLIPALPKLVSPTMTPSLHLPIWIASSLPPCGFFIIPRIITVFEPSSGQRMSSGSSPLLPIRLIVFNMLLQSDGLIV